MGQGPQFDWAHQLGLPVLEHLWARLPLAERLIDGAPRVSVRLGGTGDVVGAVHVYDAPGLEALVLTAIDSPAVWIRQLVAFTPTASALPHLSFESSANPGGAWLSVDLIPRVACTENLAWASHVYEPLSDALWDAHSNRDLRQSVLRARHRMRLSPWLASMQIEGADAARHARELSLRYVDRFCDLLRDGIPAHAQPVLTPDELAVRDARERLALYSWDATANYRHLELLGGPGLVDTVQGLLRSPNE